MQPSVNKQAGVHHPSILAYQKGVEHPNTTKVYGFVGADNRGTLREIYHENRGTFKEDNSIVSRRRFFEKHVHLNTTDLEHGRFLPADKIHEEADKAGARVVVLSVGMGAGKTEQFKKALHQHHQGRGIMLSHRVALVKSTASRLEIADYQAIKDARMGGNGCMAYASTVHSQYQLMAIEQVQEALSGGIVGLDESESIASEFLNTTIKNEPLVLDALRQTAKGSKLLMLMDAHAGAGTAALLRALGYRQDEILLITADVREFNGYRARVFQEVEGGSDVKTAFMGRILADLREGKKVIVTSLSKTILDELDKHVAGKLPTVTAIKVTSETSSSSAAARLNADTYADYQLVMLSPSMSTGISFDKHHADSMYCFAVNASDTGTPFDALQAMLRDRAVKSRELNIYVQNINGLSKANALALVWYKQERAFLDIAGEMLNSVPESEREHFAARFEALRPAPGETFGFLRDIAVETASAKENFLAILESELQAKGATVEHCGIDALINAELTTEERKEAKAKAAEERLQAVEQSPKVSRQEAETLRSGYANNQEKGAIVDRLALDTPAKVRAVLDRHFVERETACNLDELPPVERREMLADVLDDGLVSRLREWDLVRANPADLKRIQKAAAFGVQADEYDEPGFMEKLSSDRLSWPDRGHYGRMALQAVGITFDPDTGRVSWDGDGLITDKRVKNSADRGGAFGQACQRSAKRVIESGLLPIQTIPMLLKKHPADHLRIALETYGVKLRKVRGVKPVEYIADPENIARLVALVNARRDAGRDTVAERIQRMDEYLDHAPVRKERAARRFADFVSAGTTRKPAPASGNATADDGAALLCRLWAECGRTDDVGQFLAEFAGDMQDISAGVYPVDTLKMVIMEWKNKGQYTKVDKSNT